MRNKNQLRQSSSTRPLTKSLTAHAAAVRFCPSAPKLKRALMILHIGPFLFFRWEMAVKKFSKFGKSKQL
jgi:hypothetical protein